MQKKSRKKQKFKDLKKHIITWNNAAWTAILGMLGFTACKENVGKQVDLYASPYATHTISGKVTDEAAAPFKGIKVDVTGGGGRTSYTDKNGDYLFSVNNSPDAEYSLTFTDIDGEENGGDFGTKSIEVEFVYSDLTGGSGWFKGEATKRANITLGQKEADSE